MSSQITDVGGFDREERLENMRSLAFIMDDLFPVPGTPWRFGLGPVLGLIPGIGDMIGYAFSIYIIYQGKQLGLSKGKMALMIFHATVDFVVGLVPVIGDIFDFFYKANDKNLRIMGVKPKNK